MPIRVVVADDHPVVRQGLRSLFAALPDLLLVGEVEDGRELLNLIDAVHPHVVVLDLRMPDITGIEVLRRLRHSHADVRAVVLSAYHEPAEVLAAIEAGATGYLLKSADYRMIVAAVRAAARGEHTLSPTLVGTLFHAVEELSETRLQHDSGLDRTSLQVLAQLAEGATNTEIAARLHWSEATVKRRVQEILTALGARNRAQAVAKALRHGWI